MPNQEMNSVTIRPAHPPEAPQLTAIAIEAKGHWGYPEEWMNLWKESLTITPAYVKKHHVFVAEAHVLLGFYALVEGSSWELDHFWVSPRAMGRGIGQQLFRHATGVIRTLAPGCPMSIEADPNAEGFYVQMGAKRVGEVQRDWKGLIRVLPLLEFAPTAEERPLL